MFTLEGFHAYLQVPSRHLDMAIEQLPHQISPSPFSSRNATPYTSPSHYATPASARSAIKKVRYTEIDVSLYDNPRLRQHKGGVGEPGVQEGEGAEPLDHKQQKKEKKLRKSLPHEELLLFVGREWKDLAVEVRLGY